MGEFRRGETRYKNREGKNRSWPRRTRIPLYVYICVVNELIAVVYQFSLGAIAQVYIAIALVSAQTGYGIVSLCADSLSCFRVFHWSPR